MVNSASGHNKVWGRGGEWSTSRPGLINPEKKAPGTHWIGGWVGLRDGRNTMKKRKKKLLPLLGIEPRPSIYAVQTELKIICVGL
jgi:hypothetical protein